MARKKKEQVEETSTELQEVVETQEQVVEEVEETVEEVVEETEETVEEVEEVTESGDSEQDGVVEEVEEIDPIQHALACASQLVKAIDGVYLGGIGQNAFADLKIALSKLD